MPNAAENTTHQSLARRRSRSATAEATANGTAALLLAFLADEFAPPAILAIAVGCVVAGAVARALSDHISQRYSGRRPLYVVLPPSWEWVTACVQVGLAALLAWAFGAAVGMVVAAIVAGAALPGIEPARRSWQGLAKIVGGAD